MFIVESCKSCFEIIYSSLVVGAQSERRQWSCGIVDYTELSLLIVNRLLQWLEFVRVLSISPLNVCVGGLVCEVVTSSGLCSTLTHACTACSLHRAIQILLPDSDLPADFRHWLLEPKNTSLL